MPRAVFLGTGHFLPERVVTNDDLAVAMDTTDEWIRQRTGIEERRYVDFDAEAMGSSEMGSRSRRCRSLQGRCRLHHLRDSEPGSAVPRGRRVGAAQTRHPRRRSGLRCPQPVFRISVRPADGERLHRPGDLPANTTHRCRDPLEWPGFHRSRPRCCGNLWRWRRRGGARRERRQ